MRLNQTQRTYIAEQVLVEAVKALNSKIKDLFPDKFKKAYTVSFNTYQKTIDIDIHRSVRDLTAYMRKNACMPSDEVAAFFKEQEPTLPASWYDEAWAQERYEIEIDRPTPECSPHYVKIDFEWTGEEKALAALKRKQRKVNYKAELKELNACYSEIRADLMSVRKTLEGCMTRAMLSTDTDGETLLASINDEVKAAIL